jgi:hypothetical protein
MSHELGARAVIVLHENGQVLHRYGWINESEFPTMAALIAAMIATGKSLGQLGENFPGSPSRFACDSDDMGLYTVSVTPEIWLAVLYEQPLNPGQFRMKVRRYSSMLEKLGLAPPRQWEVPHSGTAPGRTMAPAATGASVSPEKITPTKSSLFANITDEEIDDIFDNARS